MCLFHILIQKAQQDIVTGGMVLEVGDGIIGMVVLVLTYQFIEIFGGMEVIGKTNTITIIV